MEIGKSRESLLPTPDPDPLRRSGRTGTPNTALFLLSGQEDEIYPKTSRFLPSSQPRCESLGRVAARRRGGLCSAGGRCVARDDAAAAATPFVRRPLGGRQGRAGVGLPARQVRWKGRHPAQFSISPKRKAAHNHRQRFPRVFRPSRKLSTTQTPRRRARVAALRGVPLAPGGGLAWLDAKAERFVLQDADADDADTK